MSTNEYYYANNKKLCIIQVETIAYTDISLYNSILVVEGGL